MGLWRYTILFFVLVITVSGYFFLMRGRGEHREVTVEYTSNTLSDADYQESLSGYLSLVENIDPSAALGALRKDAEANDALFRSCHALAHEIGRASFEKYQDFATALKYKDDLCNSGYLHGVIENYFNGRADIDSLMAGLCDAYPEHKFMSWQCHHGVGHALMYFSDNDLPASLARCARYADSFARTACTGGAYMENASGEPTAHPSKFLSDSDINFPCNESYAIESQTCYIYVPARYLSLNENGSLEDMLGACDEVDVSHRDYCYQGAGDRIAKAYLGRFDAVQNTCGVLEGGGRAACIKGAVDFYIGQYGTAEQTGLFCSSLDGDDRFSCIESAIEVMRLF